MNQAATAMVLTIDQQSVTNVIVSNSSNVPGDVHPV